MTLDTFARWVRNDPPVWECRCFSHKDPLLLACCTWGRGRGRKWSAQLMPSFPGSGEAGDAIRLPGLPPPLSRFACIRWREGASL